MIEAECIRQCYDSQGCKLYEVGKVYTIDEYAFSHKEGNGLIKHFLPVTEMDREHAREAERKAEAQRQRETRVADHVRARDTSGSPSERPRRDKRG